MRRSRTAVLLALLLTLVVVLAGCSQSNSNKAKAAREKAAGGGQSTGWTFAVITHGAAGDAFWNVVKNGAEQAGKDNGVTIDYASDGDPARQAQLIDNAVSRKVDGLVVSMADPDALKSSIQAAVKAGIPVVTINSGEADSAAFGAIAHVGQPEATAGAGAGTQLKNAGLKHVLCVIHEAGNIGLEQRCAGAASTEGGRVENLQVDIDNLQQAESTIKSKLQADPSIDGVLALNGQVATTAVQAVADSGSKAKVATFDLSADVISDIQKGSILFAVDQQQYEQGYLPVVLLRLYKTNGNTVGGGQPVLTGPSYVTKSNAAQVAKLAAQGTR